MVVKLQGALLIPNGGSTYIRMVCYMLFLILIDFGNTITITNQENVAPVYFQSLSLD